jgi:hypothetical protein
MSLQPFPTPRFPAVSAEEMAFAMAVFVNAGTGTMSSRLQTPLTANAEWARDQIYLDLLPQPPTSAQAAHAGETSLHQAFSIVWEQFEGHNQQHAVCARLLAFHFLMELTEARAVENWLRQSPENPTTVILDNAVVAAVGCVPLREDGQMRENELASAVRQHLKDEVSREPVPLFTCGRTGGFQATC